MIPLILRLDISGLPLGWIGWQEAIILYSKDRIGWTAGEHQFRFYGGVNRITQKRSSIEIHSIVAVKSADKKLRIRTVPPLTNRELFRRDQHLCMYCGRVFKECMLTRDHVMPRSRGGKNTWTNVVAACKRCNHVKGNRLPQECGMPLLALPYTPNYAEYLALRNSSRILADQMAFLKAGFTRHCRWVEVL